MRKITIVLLMLAASSSQAQVQDTAFNVLSKQVKDLQSQIDDMNDRSRHFANTNNAAALLYFGGVVLAAINYSQDEPSNDVYYVAGGLAVIGTATLYFSGNALKLKGRGLPNKNYWE